VLTKRQQNVLESLNFEISRIGINVHINVIPKFESSVVSIDVEHDESGGFVGCGFCGDDRNCYYISDIHVLNDIDFSSLDIIAHNGVSDIECLRIWGIEIEDEQLIWDTMLLGHIIDSSQKDYSLKGMAKRELGIVYPSYDDIVGKRGLKAERITLDKQPLELVAKYNAMDCYVTYKLYERQHANIGVL
jgi:DNA polymerase I-like protein with 3'-5' exonuclease and polymerase domains